MTNSETVETWKPDGRRRIDKRPNARVDRCVRRDSNYLCWSLSMQMPYLHSITARHASISARPVNHGIFLLLRFFSPVSHHLSISPASFRPCCDFNYFKPNNFLHHPPHPIHGGILTCPACQFGKKSVRKSKFGKRSVRRTIKLEKKMKYDIYKSEWKTERIFSNILRWNERTYSDLFPDPFESDGD